MALLEQPELSKFWVKFDKTCVAERPDVYLLNESSLHQSEARVYKIENSSLYLLDDPRTRFDFTHNI